MKQVWIFFLAPFTLHIVGKMCIVLYALIVHGGMACRGGIFESCFPTERRRIVPSEDEFVSFSEMLQVASPEIEVAPLVPLVGCEDILRPPRLEAQYTSRIFSNLDRRIRNACSSQILSDQANPNSVPLLGYEGELVAMERRLELLLLDEKIATRRNSVVFSVKDRPDLVIKYQANCDSENGVHPLIYDFAFLKHIEDLNLSPRVYFLSPAVKFSLPITPKTNFQKSFEETMECVADKHSSVRYMVMDRISESVGDLINEYIEAGVGRVPLKIAAEITKSLIQELEKLHTVKSVIHGDVHMGNVVILSRDPWKVGLIDFGLSSFGDFAIGQELKIPQDGPLNHCLYSPFEIQGYRTGYRDDVYRAILMMSMMANGVEFVEYCLSLESDEQAMFDFKMNQNLFDFPGKDFEYPDIDSLHIGVKGVVEDRLNRLASLVRDNSDSPDQKPNYRAIIALLEHLVSLI